MLCFKTLIQLLHKKIEGDDGLLKSLCSGKSIHKPTKRKSR